MDLQRRTVLQLTGVVAAGGLVAACSSSTDASAPATTGGGGTGGPTAAPATSAPATSAAATSGGGAAALAATSDVPVGGGLVLADQSIVITQPTEGDFKAFTAVCTHQGCLVESVSDGAIHCPCHGSAFSAEDGSVVNGPANGPLTATAITVDGDSIVLA